MAGTLKDDIISNINNSLSKLPLGCEGRVVSYDSSTNKAIIEIYDDKSGMRRRCEDVEVLAQAAYVLNLQGRTYQPGDYVYVGWLGAQKTNPVIMGHLRSAVGIVAATTDGTAGTDTTGTDTTTATDTATTTTNDLFRGNLG